MMRSFSEQIHDRLLLPGLDDLVVNDNQVAYVDIKIVISFQVFSDTLNKFSCWYCIQ